MDDQAPPTTDELSEGQQIALKVLGISSGSLSLIGSCTIAFKILRDLALKRYMTPYDRIILGLSTCDILSSISFIIQPFLLPSETGLAWAFGSTATCEAAGALSLSLPWAIWYNCILSYYFLLTVISQLRLKNYVRTFEPWMHLSGLYFPIAAIIIYQRGGYGMWELSHWCSITDPMLADIVFGIPFSFTMLSLIVNYSVIYAVVRKSLQSSENVARPSAVHQARIKREAMTLMFLYIGFFFLSITPFIIRKILRQYCGFTLDEVYPLSVLNYILFPLQGFFNVFIYLKPTYTRFRTALPRKPMHYVLYQALFNPDVPQLTSPSELTLRYSIVEGAAANPNEAMFSSNFLPRSSSSDSSASSKKESSNAIAEGSNEEDSNSSDSGPYIYTHTMPRISNLRNE